MIDTGFRLLVSAGTPFASAERAAAAVPSDGIFYYALGGGMGHLMRAHAIARAFARRDSRPFVTLTNARFSQPEVPIRLQLEGRPDREALTELIRALLPSLRPSVFVADAFPAGILSELGPLFPALACPKVAVLRRLEPAWVERWQLPQLLAEAFDAVALIEPGARFAGFPGGVRSLETAPVLARNASELRTAADARAALGHSGDRPLAVAAITGDTAGDHGILRAAETHLRRTFGETAALRLAAPLPPVGQEAQTVFRVPLMEVMTGVDLLIGPCGYNLAHETAALGVPAIFLPQRRTYDDQRGRAEGRKVARHAAELEELIVKHLSDSGARALVRPVPRFENGAEEVAGLIAGFP